MEMATWLAGIGTFLAVGVAYMTLYKQSKPHILVFYVPNQKQASIIDLVVTNIGSGNAIDVRFSVDLPIHFFGIDHPTGDGNYLQASGFPMIAPGQRYEFQGGQFGGLQEELGDGLRLLVSYKYKNPIGCLCTDQEDFVLSVSHLGHLPASKSAEQTIVDAFKLSNGTATTLHEIRDELRKINNSFERILNLGEGRGPSHRN
ncbi:hypothetical protein [Alcaligenes sp. SMD-FA]|uniref:hypothetical protein n=1 Tax=Alcaligenes sp. SMD-FA TaxID=2991054 RepID=UPI002226E040|nr:hypothetical protein [Alcaligenes sp. SMD-FA]UYY88092.1 hypothetical protein OKX01_04085 [Alcaligenes sp. SMD-FA]